MECRVQFGAPRNVYLGSRSVSVNFYSADVLGIFNNHENWFFMAKLKPRRGAMSIALGQAGAAAQGNTKKNRGLEEVEPTS